jgi:hypothetical protein
LQQLIELVIPHTNKIMVITAGNIGATPMFTGAELEAVRTLCVNIQ